MFVEKRVPRSIIQLEILQFGQVSSAGAGAGAAIVMGSV